jgi:hypothetical protein
MVFKEILSRIGQRNREHREELDDMQRQMRFQKLAEDRMKSADERELERFQKEEHDELVKKELEYFRKKREHDINFNHNPIDAENITTKTSWNIMSEPNQFKNTKSCLSGKNIFTDSKRLF